MGQAHQGESATLLAPYSEVGRWGCHRIRTPCGIPADTSLVLALTALALCDEVPCSLSQLVGW
jgi:hypothetical protein